MAVYHVELRQFPKRLQRFNLSGPEIGAVALVWAQEKVLVFEDERWSPHRGTLTIIEGPEIPIEGVSLARGWRTATHEGSDVTERVLEEARKAIAAGVLGEDGAPPAGPEPPPAAGSQPASTPAKTAAAFEPRAGGGASAGEPSSPGGGDGLDPLALAVELGALLGPNATRLLGAWRAVSPRALGLSPSETLALAERELERERGGEG